MATKREVINRVQKFRNWFARLPEKAINLTILLDAPYYNGEGLYRPSFLKKTAQEKISCGATGCLLGWIRQYPPFRKGQATGQSASANEFLGGNAMDYMFEGRTRLDVSHKKEALDRLDSRLTELRRA